MLRPILSAIHFNSIMYSAVSTLRNKRMVLSAIRKLLYPPQTKFAGVYRNHPVCLSVCPSVCLSRVNLTLVITFQPIEIRISYYTCWFLVTRPFFPYQKIWPCDIDLDFWPTFEKNLTLDIIFEPKKIRLSYYACWFLLTRPFCPYQKNLTLWPWPWLLTYFW